MDPTILLVLGLGVTAVLWGITWARHREMRGVAVRGLGAALAGALVVALLVAAVATLYLNGREFFGTISLGTALVFGLFVGAAIGAAFFWLNAVVLAIGLWFKPGDGWAIGAVLATPIVIAAIGFGFVAYNTYQYQSQQPQQVNGTFALELDGARLGHVSATAAASCALGVDGGLSLTANAPAADGRQVDVQMGLAADGEVGLAIVVGQSQAFPGKGWEPGPDTTRLVDGWSRAGGQVTLTDLVPLGADLEPDPTERWSGSLSWTCAAR